MQSSHADSSRESSDVNRYDTSTYVLTYSWLVRKSIIKRRERMDDKVSNRFFCVDNRLRNDQVNFVCKREWPALFANDISNDRVDIMSPGGCLTTATSLLLSYLIHSSDWLLILSKENQIGFVHSSNNKIVMSPSTTFFFYFTIHKREYCNCGG